MRLVPALVAGSMMLAACAESAVGPRGEGTPSVAEVVCESDGSITVLTPEVLVQPDGIHVHAVSHLDEPASIVGLTQDIEPGPTDWIVTTSVPGRVDVGCSPFSEHATGEEPATTSMEVLDPDGLYVQGELQCSGMASNMIGEFAEAPIEGDRIPLERARAVIRGLDEDDEVFHVGYPEQVDPTMAVRRDGQIVATYRFVTFDGEEWIIASSQICSSSGLR